MPMKTRALGPFQVSEIGFGCMSLSHAYGAPPDPETGAAVLHRALDLGYTFLDTAALYGDGANETLIGRTLKARRDAFTLASKCGIRLTEDGRREIDGRPSAIRAVCEDSLRRLQVEVIDLYYLHRWDRRTPIEDSVGTLGDLVREGKIRSVGLSEVGAQTLRRAHREYPITALQSEYSLWTRNPEIAVLEACRELGVAFVAFSPLGRGFLAGAFGADASFPKHDIRASMPRFQGENLAANLRLLAQFREIASDAGCTLAQLALAWVLARGPHVIPIPGTARLDHLEENAEAADVTLAPEVLARLDALFTPEAVRGPRYAAAAQSTVDTEEFPA